MLGMIRRAMADPDAWVVQLDYTADDGTVTRRIVSPIRFEGKRRVMVLCLAREEPRLMWIARIANVVLVPAHEVQMPTAIIELKSID